MSPPFFWHALVAAVSTFQSAFMVCFFFFFISRRNERQRRPPSSSANKAEFSIDRKTSRRRNRAARRRTDFGVFAAAVRLLCITCNCTLTRAAVPSCKIDFARSESWCEHSATLFRNNCIIVRFAMCPIEWEKRQMVPLESYHFRRFMRTAIDFCLSLACGNSRLFARALLSRLPARSGILDFTSYIRRLIINYFIRRLLKD